MAKVRVRLRNGKLYDVKDAAFVELCNDSNNLVGLVYVMDNNVLQVCYPGDENFARYLVAYKGKGIPMRVIKPKRALS